MGPNQSAPRPARSRSFRLEASQEVITEVHLLASTPHMLAVISFNVDQSMLSGLTLLTHLILEWDLLYVADVHFE